MRLIISIYSTGRANVVFEDSIDSVDGCILNIDRKAFGKGKVTIITEAEYGFKHLVGFSKTSDDQLDETDILLFISEQYDKIGRGMPQSIIDVVRFVLREKDEHREECGFEHPTRECAYEGRNRDSEIEAMCKEFTHNVIKELGRPEYNDPPNLCLQGETFKKMLAAYTVAFLTAGLTARVDASSDMYNSDFFGLRSCEGIFYNGISRYEQIMRCGMSERWNNFNEMDMVRSFEIHNPKSAKKESSDDGEGCLLRGGSCLWLGERRFLPDRQVSVGVFIHPSLGQLPQISDSNISYTDAYNLCGKTNCNNSDEVGIHWNRNNTEEALDCLSIIAILAVVMVGKAPDCIAKGLMVLCLLNCLLVAASAHDYHTSDVDWSTLEEDVSDDESILVNEEKTKRFINVTGLLTAIAVLFRRGRGMFARFVITVILASQIMGGYAEVSRGACAVSHNDKVDCGFVGTNETDCYNDGCCWDPILFEGIKEDIPWCYYPGRIAIGTASTTRDVEVTDQTDSTTTITTVTTDDKSATSTSHEETTTAGSADRFKMWNETDSCYLDTDYGLEVRKYKVYSLTGRKVVRVVHWNDVSANMWADSWKGDILGKNLGEEANLEDPKTIDACSKYSCSYDIFSSDGMECDIPIPESTMKINNRTYNIGSKPFESGFVSTVSRKHIRTIAETKIGLKTLVSCSHNRKVYSPLETGLCVVQNVNVSGIVWENCLFSCDICAFELSRTSEGFLPAVSVNVEPTWLPDAVKVYNCREDSRLRSHQRVCNSIDEELPDKIELGKDVTYYVSSDMRSTICQWNEAENVNIRTCWCRQLNFIYITNCRLLGDGKPARSFKSGSVGSLYIYEKGDEWKIVSGDYVPAGAKSEEVERRWIDAIQFGVRTGGYMTKYGFISGSDINSRRTLKATQIQISLVKSLGDNLVLTQKTKDLSDSRFIATSIYDNIKKKIMTRLTENRKNLTIYDGSSWFWYGSMKGCGGYGAETFCVNNVLQESKLYDNRAMRNISMMMGSSPSRNGWLLAVYIIIGYLCTGGFSQIFHIGRYIMYLLGKRKPYYRKMMYLQAFCLQNCYGSELDIKHQMFSSGSNSHVIQSFMDKDGNMTPFGSGAHYNWKEETVNEMPEEEMFRELNTLDNDPQFYLNRSFFRTKMRFIIFWFPQWMYLAILLQFVWSLLTFWNVGAYYWYKTREERNNHNTFKAAYSNVASNDEKDDVIKFSKTKQMKPNTSDAALIVKRKRTEMRFNPKREKTLRFLFLFFWLMIGRVECVTRTYVINCEEGNCVRAIDLDEQMFLTNGSSLQIDLKNPETGKIDGQILLSVVSLTMTVRGTYDYTAPQSVIDHYHYFSDGSDCDTNCNDPLNAIKDTDFGKDLDASRIKQLMTYGRYAWDNAKERSGMNDGYCIGIAAIQPQWGSALARAFRLAETESVATIILEIETDTESIKETFTSTLSGNSFNFGDDNKIQFIEEKNQFAELTNERLLCWFEAGQIETKLDNCVSGASGINEGLSFRSVGEGEYGYHAWRAPALTNSISSAESACQDCNMGDSCQCDCSHSWNSGVLKHFNKEDVMNMGTKTPPANCVTSVKVSNIEESEEQWGCIDWETRDKDDCDKKCPTKVKPCWEKRKTRKPGSIDISSSGCEGGRMNVKGSIKSKYDASTVSNVLDSSDVQITGAGCWGTIYQYMLKFTAKDRGTLYLISNTLQVPSVINIASESGSFNGTAALDSDQYYFYILDKDGHQNLITVQGSLDPCDGIVDGGNGEEGNSDLDTGLAKESWIWWIIAIASVIGIVLILTCLLKFICSSKGSKIIITDTKKEK